MNNFIAGIMASVLFLIMLIPVFGFVALAVYVDNREECAERVPFNVSVGEFNDSSIIGASGTYCKDWLNE